MISRMSYLFALIALAATFTTTHAIMCWECSSNINPGCGDAFNNRSFAMVDCDQRVLPHMQNQKATLCRKIVQKIQDDPIPRIVRTCGWIADSSTDGECIKRSGTFSILVEYCTCSTDGCNSAITQKISLGLAMFVLALTAINRD